MEDAHISLDENESIGVSVGRLHVFVWRQSKDILSLSFRGDFPHAGDDFQLEVNQETGEIKKLWSPTQCIPINEKRPS